VRFELQLGHGIVLGKLLSAAGAADQLFHYSITAASGWRYAAWLGGMPEKDAAANLIRFLFAIPAAAKNRRINRE
jgi:hypothetical protein